MSLVRPASALTIGFFDGVHLGHQALLRRVLAAAQERGLQPGAVTFDLHSLEVLHGRRPLHTILTTAEKVETLRSFGLADVDVIHFTPEFAAQSGEQFVEDHLLERLAARYLVVGRDFRFGRGRAWGADEMQAIAARHGVATEIVDLVDDSGGKVSSRDIRKLLADGEVAAAAVLLGRPYRLAGEVVRGQQLGRTIGFPTANLSLPPRKIVPRRGVYAVRAATPRGRADGVMNIGLRPTVSGERETYEVHLFDCEADLYDQTLVVDLVARLRDERKFDGLPALQAQIHADCEQARALLAAGDEP